ncbi:MAG: metallophosphoesterase [Bacteroidetes bacterium]|nr:metallophosphoesterase [Bacteroidota bacterium]
MRQIIFIIIFLLIQWYASQAIRTLSKNTFLIWGFWLINILVIANVFYQFSTGNEDGNLNPGRNYAIGLMMTMIVPSLVLVFFMFGEDIVRMAIGFGRKMFGSSSGSGIPSRRKFISQIALGIAALPFAGMLYGMYKGRYNYKVLKYQLFFPDLPDDFDGYRITQISDIHSGSFDNREKIEYAVDLINEQKSDLMLFTGDLVNNKASEMDPWKSIFSKLKATDGVYSVLGNHDYGDYVQWPSEKAKQENLQELKNLQKEIGFNLLLNEHRYIEKGNSKLALVGVENWGAGGFKKAGDLSKASDGLSVDEFKILMSHDPSHWQQQVVDDAKKYHLTLSGHTHGMQFGIEIPGWIKWSPVQWRYKYWAGVYQEKEQFINVNRGFGFLAYPGRVGIWPEITVIELKKGKQQVQNQA